MKMVYSKEHEWVKLEGNRASIGITDHAQHALGEIVFVELPEVGAVLENGDVLGVVESVKAASDIYTPLTGTVIEVNNELEDHPEKINEDPLGSWIAVLEIEDAQEAEDLMSESEYAKYCEEE